LIFSCNFAPGSYPYASRYEISLPETVLANRILVFKKNNPEYIVPKELGFEDGRRTATDHWYHIYFKNPLENQVIKTWIRKESETETILAFVATKEISSTNGKWKLINKDYNSSENKKVIETFKKMILSKLDIPQFIQK